MAPERTCEFCGATFQPLRNRASTKFCSRAHKDAARVASGEAAKASQRSNIKRRYGLTVEQVDEMAEKGCAICKTTDWPGRHKRPTVDHDHVTGEVRGILCAECNAALGKFHDDPVLLQAALDYLLGGWNG